MVNLPCIIVRPHRSTTYVYRCGLYVIRDGGWSICRSVCHNGEPCKKAKPIEMPFGLWTQVGPRNRALDRRRRIVFLREKRVAHCNFVNAWTLCRELCIKSSAVAEMVDRGHSRHGPKRGGCCAPFTGGAGPLYHSVAWAEVYFRTKWRLHPSSRWLRPLFGRGLSPHLTQSQG